MEANAAMRRHVDETCLSAVGKRDVMGKKLFVASRNGDLEIMKQLIRAGVCPNYQDYCRDTALHWASSCGAYKAVRLLLGEGADPNLVSEMGRTPLHNAAAAQDLRTIHELLKSGCLLTVQDYSGYTPLDIAYTIKQNCKMETRVPLEVVRILKEAGSERTRESSPSQESAPEGGLRGEKFWSHLQEVKKRYTNK